MPVGGDAVVMLEHTTKTKKGIKVLVSLPPAANVSKKGEDVKKGETGLDSGVRLKPQHLGLLASLGVKDVEVVKKPTVALLATGNELVALEEKKKPNQIVEVNSIILSGMCAEVGAEGRHLGIAKDDEDELEEKVREGLAKADIVITTGGTSVGVRDLVPKVVTNMEANGVVAHGIAMRPGMPTALAVVQKKPVIMLSGNPVAAMIGFDVFVRPLIQKLLGIKEGVRMKVNAILTRRVAGVLGRRVFVRVTVLERQGEFFAEPLRVKGSSIITSMTKANGYVIIPEAREGLRQHETVAVHLFDAIRSAKNV
jgi:molybdopterin molybdotransferase